MAVGKRGWIVGGVSEVASAQKQHCASESNSFGPSFERSLFCCFCWFCAVLCLACLVCLPRVFFHSLLPPRAVDMRPLDWPLWTLGGGWGAATTMCLVPLSYCTVDLKCAQLFRTVPRMTPCDTHQ